MKFGAGAGCAGQGGIAVHSIRKAGCVLKKGTVVGDGRDRGAARRRVAEIVVARLEPDDVPRGRGGRRDRGGRRRATGVRIDRAFTGRANLFAEAAGVLVVDKDAIDRLNLVDESITFATLPAYKPVVAGEMIATVKIIPFAVARSARDGALAVARTARAADPGRALPHRQGRGGLDRIARPRRQGGGQDPAGDARPAGAAGAAIVAERRRAA